MPHTFTRSNITADTVHGIRYVYAVEGKFSKPAAARPFLTTIAACRQFVRDHRRAA